MFHFLSSLFSPSAARPPGLGDELIEDATDRVIMGTDKRLYGLGSYRRQLQEPVEKAVVHVINLIEAYSGIGASRILLPGWLPVDELPAGRESIADVMRYL